MNFEQYQRKSRGTAIYKAEVEVIYPAMKLAAEAGEVANKIGKRLLADGVKIRVTKARRRKILAECGDVLWYLANLCTDLDANLNDIALNNLMKLNSRKKRGKLVGSGDNR